MKESTARMLVLTAFTLVISLSPLSSKGWCANANWQFVDENDDSSFYYDTNSATKPNDQLIQVTVRVVYTDKGKANALTFLKPAKTFANLHESRYLYDFNCTAETSKLMEVTHLDDKGKELKKSDLSADTDWEDILPNTRIGLVSDAVCPAPEQGGN